MKQLLFIILIVTVLTDSTAQNLFAAKDNGSWGYIDVTANWVIKPVYSDAEPFSNGFGCVKQKGKWSYVGVNSQVICAFRFDKASPFDGEVARVGMSKEGALYSYALIDTSGNFIAKRFDLIRKFSPEGLAMAKSEYGDWGFINKKGEWVVKPAYGALRDFHDGLAMARSKGKWGYINQKGEWIIQPHYNHANSFSDGIASVETKDGWQVIDKQGNPADPRARIYPLMKPFSDGVAVARDEKWGIVDRTGHWMVTPRFDYLGSFHEGMARTRNNQNWGAIDKAGNWVIKPEFDNVTDFSEGITRVRKGTVWGYIDKTGKWIVEPKFQAAERFINGYAIVKIKNKWGVIDKTGKFTAECKFDKLRSLEEAEAVDDEENEAVEETE